MRRKNNDMLCLDLAQQLLHLFCNHYIKGSQRLIQQKDLGDRKSTRLNSSH